MTDLGRDQNATALQIDAGLLRHGGAGTPRFICLATGAAPPDRAGRLRSGQQGEAISPSRRRGSSRRAHRSGRPNLSLPPFSFFLRATKSSCGAFPPTRKLPASARDNERSAWRTSAAEESIRFFSFVDWSGGEMNALRSHGRCYFESTRRAAAAAARLCRSQALAPDSRYAGTRILRRGRAQRPFRAVFAARRLFR